MSKHTRVNDHPQSGGLEFSATGRKGESTSVLSTLNLHPGAKHPVCFARIKFLQRYNIIKKYNNLFFKCFSMEDTQACGTESRHLAAGIKSRDKKAVVLQKIKTSF